MTDPIEADIAGRLMLLLTKRGILDNRCLSIYQSSVDDAVRARMTNRCAREPAVFDAAVEKELAMLEASLAHRGRVEAREVIAAEPDDITDDKQGEQDPDPHAEEPSPRRRRLSSGSVPTVKSMEEKLKEARKPVQHLLKEDCVRVGLIDAKQAKKLVFGMTGKTSEQAEQDIVEQLSQTLQDQVKSFISKAKGGPWSDPRTQEDLRKDIHAARSVRGILMLSRQVLKEYRTWEKEHHRGGILGLFSPRRQRGH